MISFLSKNSLEKFSKYTTNNSLLNHHFNSLNTSAVRSTAKPPISKKLFGFYSFCFVVLISASSFATLPYTAQRPEILARNRVKRLKEE